MNEFLNIPTRDTAPQTQLLVATIGTVNTSGATLILDGASTATTKRYKHVVTGQTLAAGDRVLIAQISGTYVVLGKIAY